MLRKMDGKCLLAVLSPKHEMKSKDSQKKVSITLANDLNKDWVWEVTGQWDASCGFILFKMKTLAVTLSSSHRVIFRWYFRRC